MKTGRQVLGVVLFLAAVALLVMGLSAAVFPQWLSLPGGLLLLGVAAFVGLTSLGDGLKGWHDLLFGEKPAPPVTPPPQAQQTMEDSARGTQKLKLSEGAQTQTMRESPGGKQEMS